MEDSTIFIIITTLNLFAYIRQTIKLYTSKDSQGVSLQGYIITISSMLFLYFTAESQYIIYIVYFEFIILFLIISFAFIYDKTNTIFNENKFDFMISFLCSCVYITGISQAIKSFKSKENITSVSISSYVIWFFFKIGIIFMATNQLIIVATSVTLLVYLFIISDTILKNMRLKQDNISLENCKVVLA